MKQRFVFGVVLIALLVGIYLADVHVFPRPIATRVVIWLVALGALREVLQLGSRKVECSPGLFIYGGVAMLAVVVPSIVSGQPVSGALLALAAVLGGGIRLLGMAPHRSAAGAFPEAVLLALGIAYTGGLLSFLDRLLLAPGGVATMYAVVAVSKVSDLAGYLVGSTLGRKRIAPALSPKKSWEGSIAGVLASAGLAALLSAELAGPPAFAALIGVLIGAASLLGDLIESGFKRWAEAKDSAKLIPEFGGFLDLVDGILLAAPVAVVCLHGS